MSIQAVEVQADSLLQEVLLLKNAGYRFVTMSCTDLDDDTVEILYHFDKELELKNLRVQHKKAAPIPSISGILFAAFLVENEIRDQFGVAFEGLILDFNRTLFLDEEVSSVQVPLANNCKIYTK